MYRPRGRHPSYANCGKRSQHQGSHLQDEVHEVLEGRLAGEGVVQHLLEHSKSVDVVQHRLAGDSVAGFSTALFDGLPSSLLRRGVSLTSSSFGQQCEMRVCVGHQTCMVKKVEANYTTYPTRIYTLMLESASLKYNHRLVDVAMWPNGTIVWHPVPSRQVHTARYLPPQCLSL